MKTNAPSRCHVQSILTTHNPLRLTQIPLRLCYRTVALWTPPAAADESARVKVPPVPSCLANLQQKTAVCFCKLALWTHMHERSREISKLFLALPIAISSKPASSKSSTNRSPMCAGWLTPRLCKLGNCSAIPDRRRHMKTTGANWRHPS